MLSCLLSIYTEGNNFFLTIVCFLGLQSPSKLSQIKKKNRICHQSPMQTEKSRFEGKMVMPERKFTECSALSIDPRVGISLSA